MKQQKFLATIFSSIVLAMVILKLFEGIGHRINPAISSLDRNNMESIYRYWSDLPTITIGFMLFAHFVGMLAVVLIASYMCKQLGVDNKLWAIRISSLVVFCYIAISLLRLPHPMLMNVLDPLVGLIGYIIGLIVRDRIIE